MGKRPTGKSSWARPLVSPDVGGGSSGRPLGCRPVPRLGMGPGTNPRSGRVNSGAGRGGTAPTPITRPRQPRPVAMAAGPAPPGGRSREQMPHLSKVGAGWGSRRPRDFPASRLGGAGEEWVRVRASVDFSRARECGRGPGGDCTVWGGVGRRGPRALCGGGSPFASAPPPLRARPEIPPSVRV